MSEVPTMPTKQDSGLFGKFLDFMGGTVKRAIIEIHMLMPDSILFGSILMYFLTQNISFGIFAVFIFETVLSHKLISWVASQATGSSRSSDVQCRVGYKTPQFKPERMFSHDPYPSYGVFSITSIATYLSLATKEFSSTFDSMGDDWVFRKKLAYAFAAVLPLIFIYFRWKNCDSTGDIVAAVGMAIIVGAIFFYINKSLFGEEAINFLGLPYLVSKDSQGSPIYICAADKTDPTST
jgi:hypothetical protein